MSQPLASVVLAEVACFSWNFAVTNLQGDNRNLQHDIYLENTGLSSVPLFIYNTAKSKMDSQF